MWDQANKERQNKIQVIQSQALRKISFKGLHDPTAQLHQDLKILKFCEIVHLQNCLITNQNEQNEKPAKSFSELKYCGYNHNYLTRLVTRKLLNILYINTDAYGTQPAKYHYIIDWKNLNKIFSNLSPAQHRNPKIKERLKEHFLNNY